MLVKEKTFERDRSAVWGEPELWRVACVVGGRVEGFATGVLGMWRVKRAAEVREASRARGERIVFIVDAALRCGKVGGVAVSGDERRGGGRFGRGVLS